MLSLSLFVDKFERDAAACKASRSRTIRNVTQESRVHHAHGFILINCLQTIIYNMEKKVAVIGSAIRVYE